MFISIPTKYLLPFKDVPEVAKSLAYQSTRTRANINLDSIPLVTLKKIHESFAGHESRFKSDLEFFLSLKSKKPTAVTLLSQFPEAFKKFMCQDVINGWLFLRQGNIAVPYLVEHCSYSPPALYSREYVTITLSCLNPQDLSKQEKLIYISTLYNESSTNRSSLDIGTVLSQSDLYKETPELIAQFDTHVEKFHSLLQQGFGKQLWVRGIGTLCEGQDEEHTFWWNPGSDKRQMSLEGKPGKAICDLLLNLSSSDDKDKASYSRRRNRSSGQDNAVSPEKLEEQRELTIEDLYRPQELTSLFKGATDVETVIIPLLPYIRVFHLHYHLFFDVHSSDVKLYKYKENLSEKLVIDKDTKDLVTLLTAGSSDEDEDVIEAKSQATIVALIGDPGTGKTLTAEVVSETVKTPLFKISASQLGLNAEELEDNLTQILRKAERWDAVLMIDEANAYIHSRGINIVQNAIVGVFLRLLEYYKGTLFLTTNKISKDGEHIDIDDAILSRCNAVITYEIPDYLFRKKIWVEQCKLLAITLDDSLLDVLAKKYEVSGRSIRNLLRLIHRFSKATDTPMTEKLFDRFSKFIPMTQNERKV